MDKKKLLEKLRIPAETLKQWLKVGLPHSIENNKVTFDEDEVIEWIEDRKRNSPINDLVIGQDYLNNQIVEKFKCAPQGGMRRSHSTNTLILFTDQINKNSIYKDKWIVKDGKDILHYTGMGQEGDQNINIGQNKTLSESDNLSLDVHLFETIKKKIHVYRGKVKLIEEPYFINEEDANGSLRKVIKFPLLVEHDVIRFDDAFTIKEAAQPYKTRRKTPEEIEAKARAASHNNEEFAAHVNTTTTRAASRKVTSIVYDRNENIALYAKQRAAGICQLCDQPAPFNDADGQPYLESHHIVWLSRGGLDTIENTVALCCNCHKKMHVVNDPQDVEKLKSKTL